MARRTACRAGRRRGSLAVCSGPCRRRARGRGGFRLPAMRLSPRSAARRSGPGPNSEDQRPVGKYQGPAMADLSCARSSVVTAVAVPPVAGTFQTPGCSSARSRSDCRRSPRAPRGTNVASPTICTAPPATANLLDLSLREEAHPAAIRREEWTDRPFRSASTFGSGSCSVRM